MLIKVCGMSISTQIESLADNVNFIGFIFYEKSSRYVKTTYGNGYSKKVGVFVNESVSNILEIVKTETLDYVQLHGSESVEFCREIQKTIPVIKAFGIDETFQFSTLKNYTTVVSHFLFDTKTINHGGSGSQFNWQLLENYNLETPFFLSGGINPTSIQELKKFSHPKLVGLDINSGFENSPADKNIEQIKQFIDEIKS